LQNFTERGENAHIWRGRAEGKKDPAGKTLVTVAFIMAVMHRGEKQRNAQRDSMTLISASISASFELVNRS